MKSFQIQLGYRAKAAGQWHRFGEVLHVAEGEAIEVHLVHQFGMLDGCVGAYTYADLDPQRPPMGLGRARQA